MCGHMGRSRGTIREGCGVVGAGQVDGKCGVCEGLHRAGQVDGIAKYAKVCTERAKLTESARNTPISLFFADLGGATTPIS